VQQFLARAAEMFRLAALRRLRRPVAPPDGLPSPTKPPGPTYALGLQGGGALGAFTWGVLDRLLEIPGFRLAAATGASAGAVNAVVMSAGWLAGGPDGAKAALRQFWHRVGHLPSLLRTMPSSFWFDEGRGRSELPALAFEMATSVFSPYDLNPLNHNPLRPIVAALVDFERLREADAPRLFVSATDVETGQARIFDNQDLSLDAVLASACLPHLFQAIEIDGRSYWDGGFTANPPLAPLGSYADSARVMLVLVNPTRRVGVPRTARDIASRLNQIAGNASLLRELGTLGPCDIVEPPETSRDYAVASKYNNDWSFIRHLHALGRREAERRLVS
jgi:NTE family protein